MLLLVLLLTSFGRRVRMLTLQDGSGDIDLDELRTVMTSLGYSPTDKQLEDMMAKVGSPPSGRLSSLQILFTMFFSCPRVFISCEIQITGSS